MERKPLVDPKNCERCKWRYCYKNSGGENSKYHCGYVLQNDHSRTSLHPEGLTHDCKEFEPRKRGRPKKEVE